MRRRSGVIGGAGDNPPPGADAIRLEPFEAARHAELLGRWLRRPHVSRWWGDPEEQLRSCLQERPPGGGHALIMAGARPVGYVCWEHPRRQELAAAGLDEIPDGAIDLDIMIGEPEELGRGIGPRALTLLLDRLCRDAELPLIGLATSVDNERAVRAFEKVGFRRRRRFADPGYGVCWLMTVTREEWRRRRR